MSRSRTARTLAAGVGASLIAHGAVAALIALSLEGPDREVEPDHVPIELVAPDVPEPPRAPDELPTSVVNAAQKLEAKPGAEPVVVEKPKPAPKKPAPRPAAPPPPPVEAAKEHGALAVTKTPDAGIVDLAQNATGLSDGAETPPGEDAADTDVLAEAQIAAQPIDPSLVDLRPFVPGDSKLILVLRPDRMRGTPWAAPLDQIMKPMPDYRTVIAGTGMKVADSFESIVIATPDPSDVAQTFLAARTARDDEALRAALAKPVKGEARVEWATANGATIGKRRDWRVEANDDERIFTFPSKGWVVLSRPADLPHLFETRGRRPGWLGRMTAIEAQTGEGAAGPILLMSAVDLDLSKVEIPGMAPLPSPDRMTVTITPHPDGLIFVGAAAFDDEKIAKEFHDILVAGRDEALGSIATKFILGRLHARAAVERMKLAVNGRYVTFSTSIATSEAQALFKVVASWSKGWFATAGKRRPAAEAPAEPPPEAPPAEAPPTETPPAPAEPAGKPDPAQP